jgi:hypothetical protein
MPISNSAFPGPIARRLLRHLSIRWILTLGVVLSLLLAGATAQGSSTSRHVVRPPISRLISTINLTSTTRGCAREVDRVAPSWNNSAGEVRMSLWARAAGCKTIGNMTYGYATVDSMVTLERAIGLPTGPGNVSVRFHATLVAHEGQRLSNLSTCPNATGNCNLNSMYSVNAWAGVLDLTNHTWFLPQFGSHKSGLALAGWTSSAPSELPNCYLGCPIVIGKPTVNRSINFTSLVGGDFNRSHSFQLEIGVEIYLYVKLNGYVGDSGTASVDMGTGSRGLFVESITST